MKLPIRVNLQQTRATVPLVAALAIQATAAIFFLGFSLSEQAASPDMLHSPAAIIVVCALLIGIAFAARALRNVLRRSNERQSAFAIVRATFAQVMKRQFDLWRLTRAERDTARMSLEGLDIEEIGRIRGAATGTVQSQFARIYVKSGVSNRAQFASIFLTELVGASPQASKCAQDRKTIHD